MIQENILRVSERIADACYRTGRKSETITLVAVTKGVPVDQIKIAQSCGIKIIGENRVQEALEKFPQISGLDWHMIGHLQTNKVKKALEIFSLIQSVDSIHLAQEIAKRAQKPVPILIEVNTSGEMTKFGIKPEESFQLVEEILKLNRLNLQGLMTIGPGLAVQDPEASRKSFKMLFNLREELVKRFKLSLPVLSMGMSSDFEIGIEEGSTMVRIGTLIFGPRAV